MTRLPVSGQDEGEWGDLLNAYLSVEHTPEGALKQAGTIASALQPGDSAGGDLSGTLPNPSVAKLHGTAISGTPQQGQLLTATGPTAASWQAAALPPDATTTTKGAVMLGGDLGGTASAPTTAGWRPADHGCKAWTFDPRFSMGSVGIGSAGVISGGRIRLHQTASITNLVSFTTSGGVGLTAGQCFGAIWRATDQTLIAQTGDQSSAWLNPYLRTMPLAGGPYVLPAGDYLCGLWFNGSASPNFSRASNANQLLFNFNLTSPNLMYFAANAGITTTAPAVLGTQSATDRTFFFALS